MESLIRRESHLPGQVCALKSSLSSSSSSSSLSSSPAMPSFYKVRCVLKSKSNQPQPDPIKPVPSILIHIPSSHPLSSSSTDCSSDVLCFVARLRLRVSRASQRDPGRTKRATNPPTHTHSTTQPLLCASSSAAPAAFALQRQFGRHLENRIDPHTNKSGKQSKHNGIVMGGRNNEALGSELRYVTRSARLLGESVD